jgi:hypothetical protein
MESYKPISKEWQSIECITSCIKSRIGLGKHIPINFKAELDIAEEEHIQQLYKKENS